MIRDKENQPVKKRYAVGAQLTEEERDKLDHMLNIEREKLKKMLPPSVKLESVINDASFIRELVNKEYKRRSKSNKQISSNQ